jgi:FtsP/CotA-like multicopper oxidase with cupredoxin domain
MSATLRITAVTAAVLVLVGATLWTANAWWDSRLPDTYSAMAYGTPDFGGGPGTHSHHATAGRSIATLVGPQRGAPDASFTLRAAHASVRLASGRRVDALAFNGRVPGPELRVHVGDLVQVRLVNEDVTEGVTLHWHGVDVPNAEDGVAGVTQDAVLPGRTFVYRFRAGQSGTFWYHTHQDSADDVGRGLFGAFVVEPRSPRSGLDLALVAHDAAGSLALNGRDGLAQRAVPAGTPVRLRLVNAQSTPQHVTVAGTPIRVLAVDGTDMNAPGLMRGRALVLAAGGRLDVGLTMPRHAASIGLPESGARLVLSPDGRATAPSPPDAPAFRLDDYGKPAPTPFGAASRFDRRFRLVIDQKPGFLDGRPGLQWTLNGHIFPDVPVFVVRRGDLVRVEIRNDSGKTHPMHLHGHHVLVLSHDGHALTGSPWWSDTLSFAPGDRYVVAFRADNPGIWMDHCHNLGHAAAGLTMHVAYEGFTTPYVTGGAVHNHPE